MAREVLVGGCQDVAGAVEEAGACEDETCILIRICPPCLAIESGFTSLAIFFTLQLVQFLTSSLPAGNQTRMETPLLD